MKIAIKKFHTCQTDYLVFENGSKIKNKSLLAQRSCSRRTSIGADGAVFINTTSDSSASIEAYNVDGTLSGLCEGAVRAAAELLFANGVFASSNAIVRYKDEMCTVTRLATSLIKTSFERPSFEPSSIIPLKSDKPLINTLCEVCAGGVYLSAVYSGMPFAAMIVDDVGNIDIASRGAAFQGSRSFESGINLVYIHRLSKDVLKLRVYRHGNGEVLACGNAALAAHAVVAQLGLCNSKAITAVFDKGAVNTILELKSAIVIADINFIGSITVEG